jgi:hypothetical protein
MSEQALSESPKPLGDLLFVERNDPPRRLVGMQGYYKLAGWRDADGQNRQFACEILKISPHMIKLSAPVVGPVGGWVEAQFEHLGKFEGPIIQAGQRILIMKIVGTNEDRAKVAGKLAWITDAEKLQARRFPRIVPANPESTVSLPERVVGSCEVIDYSLSGAAVYADTNPATNSVVKIGAVPGRVVRQFNGGFAVAFLVVQDPQSVEGAILQPQSRTASS